MSIMVVSNMYPDSKNPSYGIFVKRFCEQLDLLGVDYKISVMKRNDKAYMKIINYALFYISTFFRIILGDFDKVYIHYASHSSLPVILASFIKKIKIYVNVHGSDVIPQNSKQEKMQKYTRYIIDKSYRVIVPSEYFKEVVKNKYNISEKKIFILPSGGIDTNLFHKMHREKSNELRLGYVGRIVTGKGWDTLIKALSDLNIKNELIIVGDGPQVKEMKSQLKESKIKYKLYKLKPQDELVDIYNSIDVLIFSSELKESLGLVALEAMACGTPVIATDYAAMSYYIKDGYNGFKFKIGSSDDLKNKIEKFNFLSQEKLDDMSIAAIETSKKFDRNSSLLNIRNILEL